MTWPIVDSPLVDGALVGGAAAISATLIDRRRRRSGQLYRVSPGPAEPDAERFFVTAHALLPPFWRRWLGSPWISVEWYADSKGASMMLWVPTDQAHFVLSQLRHALSGVGVEPVEEDWSALPARRAARLTLARSEMLPLAVDDRIDQSVSLAAFLGGLDSGQQIRIQMLLRPRTTHAQARALGWAARLRQGRRNPLAEAIFGLRTNPATSLDRTAAGLIEAKAEHLSWAAVGRVIAEADTTSAAAALLQHLAASLRPYSSISGNSFRLARVLRPSTLTSRFRTRDWPLISTTALTTQELGGLWRPPTDPPARFSARRTPQVEAPIHLPVRGWLLGLSNFGGSHREVRQTLPDARSHTAVQGPTSSGKTTLLVRRTLEYLDAGLGCCYIDPQGDAIRDILDRYPSGRLDDLMVISPRSDRAVGFNPLELTSADEDPNLVADNAVAIFRRVFAEHWTIRCDEVMRAALLTLMRYPDRNLAHVPLLLTDSAFRSQVLKTVTEPVGLRPYWSWFDHLSESARQDLIAVLLNRLRAILTLPRLRRFLCQPRSTFSLANMMANRGVLLVDLGAGWGDTAASLAGSFLWARISQLSRLRAAQMPDARPDWPVTIDELQRFGQIGGSFAQTLATSRTYRVPLTVAFQNSDQLDTDLREGIASNARTRVLFQCSATDARRAAPALAPLTAQDLMRLGTNEAAVRLHLDREDSPGFTITTLPLPKPTDPGAGRVAALHSEERHGRPTDEVDRELERAVLGPELTKPELGPGLKARRQ
jgi:hypothetical protein